MAKINPLRRISNVRPKHPGRYPAMRSGFTMLEFIVAMIVLGIALTGLLPLEIMQSRVIESLELRYTAKGNQTNLDLNHEWNSPVLRGQIDSEEPIPREDYGNWYMIPSSDPLARKLGAPAEFSLTLPASTPVVNLVDDVDPANSDYEEVGTGWVAGTTVSVYGNDSRRHELQATPTDYAVWTFTNVAPGRYYILATWKESSDLAGGTNQAKYEIYDGATDTTPSTVFVNQQNAPSGAVYKGRPWQTLKSKLIVNGTIKVRLYANSEKAVLADAVRIVRAPQVLSLNKSFNSEDVTLKVKIPLTP
jgi:prepilin-type N-terminal cleavage/methylation domain-containing protein